MIIKAAIRNNFKRAVIVHTTGIYFDFKAVSEDYKIVDKKLTEMIKGLDIKLIVLQLTMIFADMCDHNISRFIKVGDWFRIFPIIKHGKFLIQPVNARDLGKEYYSALMMTDDKVNLIYNLSGEKTIAMIDAFKVISNNLDKNNFCKLTSRSWGVPKKFK